MHDRLARFIHANENFDGTESQAIQLASRIARSDWLRDLVDQWKADGIRDEVKRIEGYTLDYGSGERMYDHLLRVMRRDADLLAPADGDEE